MSHPDIMKQQLNNCRCLLLIFLSNSQFWTTHQRSKDKCIYFYLRSLNLFIFLLCAFIYGCTAVWECLTAASYICRKRKGALLTINQNEVLLCRQYICMLEGRDLFHPKIITGVASCFTIENYPKAGYSNFSIYLQVFSQSDSIV